MISFRMLDSEVHVCFLITDGRVAQNYQGK